MECVRCGATAMIEGTVMDGSGGDVHFYPSEISYIKRIFSTGSRKIECFACLHCSHLELRVAFTEADRQRYQEFDGPQPGVLDRIA